ncbi:Tigger transposable element-derived protein 7-like 67 [Homarus americanus]|uniref:Tigger transposable element-derived protein 7-like 67 n=1 Tax=Homarus americanus TaxID=6706 RepID=A0A8J5JSJ2_HOMAM|nr:Tigger transposable element-derived protein 7-like 67 [Homarus americanus]
MKWFVQQRSCGNVVRGVEIQAAAVKLASHMGIENFKASDGWLWRFRNRHGICHLPKSSALIGEEGLARHTLPLFKIGIGSAGVRPQSQHRHLLPHQARFLVRSSKQHLHTSTSWLPDKFDCPQDQSTKLDLATRPGEHLQSS